MLLVVTGSSPPARGTEHWLLLGGQIDRFIPACAGNGTHSGMMKSETTVHPRLRGERLLP